MFKLAMVAGTRFRAMAAADLAEWAEQIKQGLETPVQGPPEPPGPSFGQRLKEAVKRKVGASYSRIQAKASASASKSFGQKLKRAAQERAAKSPTSQHRSKSK
jgi:hypothetical protein